MRLGAIAQADAIRRYTLEVASVMKGEKVPKLASSLTVYEILTHYFDKHLKNLPSGKNARYHIPTLDKYIGKIKVLSLKKSDMENYKLIRSRDKNQRGQPISKRTIQAELQILTMAINRAVDDELLPRNPVTRFCKVSVPRRRKIVLDHGFDFGSDWIQLYKHLPEQWRLFFLVCYETAMRPSEVANLRVEWIQKVDTHYMIVVPPGSEKTGFQDRRIPVSPILEKRLIPAMNKCKSKIFASWRYDKAFRNAVKDAKLPSEVTAYALRRSRATILDAIDSSAARVALGHVPLDPHEESYVEITNERLFKLGKIEIKRIRLFKSA